MIPDVRELVGGVQLRYVSDERPGLRRRRIGRGFVYYTTAGERIRDPEILQRINSLAIPPAWEDVWICELPNGHLQATGRDARRRKQYRYHPRWTAESNRAKFDSLQAFGQALPRIRRQVSRDLTRRELDRNKVIASIVQLLDRTMMRVGNEEYVRANQSFGLTTLRAHHLQINGTLIRLRFRGKGGKQFDIDFSDRRLAKILNACQELPGQELFQYMRSDGGLVAVDSGDVNEYLQQASGIACSAKDFRTWKATALALEQLRLHDTTATQINRQQQVRVAIAHVAEALGNTPTVCRKFYIHPAIIERFLNGLPLDVAAPAARRSGWLDETERLLLLVLQSEAARASRKRALTDRATEPRQRKIRPPTHGASVARGNATSRSTSRRRQGGSALPSPPRTSTRRKSD